MLSTRKTTRSRRLAARIAVAGALAVVPLAAVAGPALADTAAPAPSAVPVDWHDHGGDWFHHGWDHDGWNHGWHHHGWNHGWVPGWFPGGDDDWGMPSTGSAG